MYFQRLTDLRQDHDLTQQQIADVLHCQREVYRRYEKGTREIPISYAIILTKFYNALWIICAGSQIRSNRTAFKNLLYFPAGLSSAD